MAKDTANVEVEIAKSNNHTMFVPAFIDEYGFSPAQFRIFARIMRRSLGGNGQGCYETIQRLSLNLGISKRIVQESLKILKLAGCIKVIPREGTSNVMTFQPCDKWVTKTKFDEIVFEVTGKRLQRDNERKMGWSGNATPSGNALPPSAETHHKGIPIKGIPKNPTAPAAETIWDEFTALQVRQGVLPATARARLGKLIKTYGQDAVVQTYAQIKETLSDRADAYAYLSASVKNYKPQSGIKKHADGSYTVNSPDDLQRLIQMNCEY